jgi:hypothetical protein
MIYKINYEIKYDQKFEYIFLVSIILHIFI